MESDRLLKVFRAYALFGETRETDKVEMDSAKFMKLCRECGVVDGTLVTPADVDLVFTRAKRRGERRIDYDGFCEALAQLSARRLPSAASPVEAFATMASHVASHEGPALHGVTTPATGGIFAKLTDHTLYTGTHKERFDGEGHGKGIAGRDSVAKGLGSFGSFSLAPGEKVHDLAMLTRREVPTDARGVVTAVAPLGRTRPGTAGAASSSSSSSRSFSGSPAGVDAGRAGPGGGGGGRGGGSFRGAAPVRASHPVPSDPTELARSLYVVFLAFAQFGGVSTATEIDGARFIKLAKECGLVVPRACTATDIDIIFTRCKRHGARRLDFAQFQAALALVGEKLFPDLEPDASFHRVVALVVAAGGPVVHGTVPSTHAGIYGKLTDTSLYTGSHRERFDAEGHGRGIEGREMRTARVDFSEITRRERKADVRGVVAIHDVYPPSASSPSH